MKKLIIVSVASVLLMGCNEKKVEYFEDGKTVRLEYEVNGDGKVDGPFKQYYRNGNVEILAEFDSEMPTGDVTLFDEKGNIKSKVTYKKDSWGELIQETFTDPRDNQVYPITKIGNQVWLAQNLNYAMEGSFCFDNKVASCDEDYHVRFGRHYTIQAALKACPDGWHLPNNDEWSELIDYVSGTSEQFVVERLLNAKAGSMGTCHQKSAYTKETVCLLNPYGFNLHFAGDFYNGKFEDIGASLWTSTYLSKTFASIVYVVGYEYSGAKQDEDLQFGASRLDEASAHSVRCIKGEPNYALEETVTSGVSSAAPNKDIGEEIISNFNMYTKLQDACFENFEEVCSLAKTGFTLPSSKAFKFGEMNNPMGIYATIKTAQASCPKGGKWEIYAEKKGKTLKYKCKVNPGCESLTSRLTKFCEVSVK